MKEREKERERARVDCRKRGETYVGTKREVNKACSSLPSQCIPAVTRQARERERERERCRERERDESSH